MKPRIALHDPLVCGLDPSTDCDRCRAAARAESDREEANRREREERAVIETLAANTGVEVGLLRRALLNLLADDLTDIVLTVQREIRQ